MALRAQYRGLARVACTAALLVMGLAPHAAHADACADAGAAAKREQALIPGHQSGRTIIGSGRAYFYAQPGDTCQEKALFVIPGDRLNAYAVYKDFTYVMYIHPRTGADTSGWIRTNRMESTGTGIAPDPTDKR